MSAITGIFYINGGEIDRKLIKKMNSTLSHRGPDGSDVWYDGNVALGHQMMMTTPESLHEKLPYQDKLSNLVITSDARIDNRKRLSEELNIENNENISDSYFILKAYQKWGEKCPEHLLGDFAFAIWDKNSEKLFCARDHMGVKPFYYYIDNDLFAFSTEIKALFNIPNIPQKPNEQKIVLFLMEMHAGKQSTFYENINSLNASNSLKIGVNEFKTNEYWTLDPQMKIKMDTEKDYVNRFREIFTEAIKCRMRSSFPIGFELSGGLDSSSIVCMADKISKENESNTPINTFSYVVTDSYKTKRCCYIEKILDKCNIKPHFFSVDEFSPFEDMETMLWHLEEPYGLGLPIFWNLSENAQKKGIRIIMNGGGGDEICLGSPLYFNDLFTSFKWLKLIKEINSYSKRLNKNFFGTLINSAFYPSLPVFVKSILIKLLQKNKKYTNLKFKSQFKRKIEREELLNTSLQNSSINSSKSRKHHYERLTSPAFQYLHEVRDRLYPPFSIEICYPFRDKRLVEFCYAVPDELKLKYGWDKYLYRIAMKDILPEEIQWRFKKHGVIVDLRRKTLLSQKSRLKEFIDIKNKPIDSFIDSDNLKNLYEKIENTHQNQNLRSFWVALITNNWLKNRGF